jgi:hypothetical protein
MVPPAKASDHPVTHKRWNSCWTQWPSQCTNALHRRTIGLSGAEEHPLGAVMCISNSGVGWTADESYKRRFIWCWSKSFGASLYDLNVSVGWTAENPPSDHPVLKPLKLNQHCYQTLRHQMNRCLYRRFIRRSLLNPLGAEFIRRI